MPMPKHVIVYFVVDILIRLLLFCIFAVFQVTPPFKRIIHPEEVWLHKNPMTVSFCPMKILWEIVIVVPSATILGNYLFHRNKTDVIQAFLAFSLTITLNVAITNILKVIIGRPRPDFFFRCFPNGVGNSQMKDCTGDTTLINEGLKSFPSGHSSVAFSGLGFLSLYIAGKMHLFAPSGKGSTLKLLLFLFPLFLACLVAISRLCDYHHHWQDVLCGSILGFFVSWLCYHNYYPPLDLEECHMPWVELNKKLQQSSVTKEI